MSKDRKSTPKDQFLSPLTNLVIGVSFITLFVSVKSADPFNTPKLVALLIISSLLTNRLIKSLKINSIKNIKVDLFFFTLIGFFLASSLISVFFSDSLFVALIGDTQRRNGFLAYLGLSILALSVSRLISFKDSNNLFRVSILTGVLFSFYGLMQISGRDFVKWDNPYNAVIGTVGNPNFASALMSIFVILAFSSLLIKNLSKFFKLLAVLCILMSFTAIVVSDSRQGLVSLAFAMLFFASVYSYLTRKKLGWAVIAISLTASSLAIAGMLQKGPLTGLLYKYSVSVRGFYWDAAIEMFKKYPLTGVGFDQYGFYFKELRSVEYPLRYGFDLTSTNAHNTFLQMFATGGLFLGLSYLFLVVSTLFVGLRLVKNSISNERIISLGILSSWIAFQAQSVISIDNIGISVWGWLLTGVIFGLASKKEVEHKNIEASEKLFIKRNQIQLLPFLTSLLILVPALILSVSLMRVESNTFMARNVSDNFTTQPNKNDNFSQQLLMLLDKHASYVLNNPLSDPNYKIQIVYNLFNSGSQDQAYNTVKEIVYKNPRNLYALDAEVLLSNQLNNPLIEIDARKKIAKLDPWNAKNYLQLMLLYKTSGNLVNAQEMRDKILSFAAQTEEAKIALAEFAK